MPSAGPLVETKLNIPRRRRALVPRGRLLDRLDRGGDAKLTLISAPAGFGKTTLLADWLAGTPLDGRTAAWLSLDQTDNDPHSFWAYLIGALQAGAPELHAGADALALLQSARPPSIEVILATLINDLAALPTEIVLVLDDYHVIDVRDVHEGMGFLVEHLPAQLHLVIATRSDPPLPLSRLRVRGELVEVRAADLRFTTDEAAAYLNEVMGLDLSGGDVATLEGRTEGWIAALQLAALSMQGRENIGEFIAEFAGDSRYIVDYLVEEVLHRQPEEVRSFLLRTSVLDRLSASLCDAVTEQHGGKEMLEALDRGNLFMVPLDDRRRWYRYHRLFADVLSTRLVDEQPDHVPELHRRASAWYERNGEASEAIRHALAAEDFAKAADLVELAAPAMRKTRQEGRLLSWLSALPADLFHWRPVLSNAFAGALLSTGTLDGVDARLRDAERWSEPETVVVDQEEFRRLPGSIAVHRAGHALARGDVADTVEHACRALDLIAEDDHVEHGAASALLGLAAWSSGDLEAAHQRYSAAGSSLQRAGYVSDVLGCAITLADIRITQGRLHDAMRTYERALNLAAEQRESVLRGTADMYVGMSLLHHERDDLESATRDLLRSQQLGEHLGLPQNPYRWRVAMARIREAQGDLQSALDLLEEAERLYTSDFLPHVRPVAAVKARVLVRAERLDEALGWTRTQGLSTDDDLSYVREFEHVTLARVLLARGSVVDALDLLERLRRAAEDGARTGSVIEILILQALAHHQLGEMQAALLPLERALPLAEPEGYVRMFVDEGAPMAALLQAASKTAIAPTYVRRLLEGFGKPEVRPRAKQVLVEPLSDRELGVLRLLASDLDGPEIAAELMVSLSTMRTHTRSIFNKLGVNNRRAAVRRAQELALL